MSTITQSDGKDAVACRYFVGRTVTGEVHGSLAKTFKELFHMTLEKPVMLPCTHGEFWALPKKDRHDAKRVPYLVAATYTSSPSPRGAEHARNGNLLILDLDEMEDGTCPASPFVKDPKLLKSRMAPYSFAAYTTASSTCQKPRMRIVVDADDIPLTTYSQAVSSIVERIGLKAITSESLTAVQPMYLPTLLSDTDPDLEGPMLTYDLEGRPFRLSDILPNLRVGTIGQKASSDDPDDLEFLRAPAAGVDLETARNALKHINPDLLYPEWFGICAGLKHQFSLHSDEEGYQLFDEWSSKGEKYAGPDDTRKKWESVQPTPRGRAPITIQSVIKKARDAGWKDKCRIQSGTGVAKASQALNLRKCILEAAELSRFHIPKRLRILGKWLCQGDLGYVFAPRGVGKTWFVMALARAISQGIELGHWEAGEDRTPVLYVDGEMPLELTRDRSEALKLGAGDIAYLHHERLFEVLGCSLNIALEDHRNAISALLEERSCRCLILDNLSSLASGVVENRGEDYEPIANWLLELRRMKITVIVVHHAGRNGLMRGHSKREDACSWILELQDAKADSDKGAKFTSHFAKPSRNTGEPLEDYVWHFVASENGGAIEISCHPAQKTDYETFLRHVREGSDQQTDIADLMGKPRGTVSKWTKRAIAEGHIKRDKQRLVAVNRSLEEAEI